MKNMKKLISIALMLALALTLSAGAFADNVSVNAATAGSAVQTTIPASAPVRASDDSANTQIQYLFANFSSFQQPEASGKWSYAVTDLNHNGQLELLAASVQGDGRYTYVKGWEVGADLSSVSEIQVSVPQDETFVDIVADTADTFFNPDNGAWFYMFYDNIVLNADESYYVKCAVNYTGGTLAFQQLAIQHNQKTGGVINTSYMDNNGGMITSEQYNAAGSVGPAQLIRSSTNFEWLDAANVTSANSLFNSYAVFKGMMQPTARAAQLTAPVGVTTNPGTGFMTITKSPTTENRSAGDTAWFVANASGWTSLTWTFVAPQGGEYSAASFSGMFPKSTVSGANSTTLTISNVSTDMSGWGVYCTFYNNGQTARSSMAYLYVVGAGSGVKNTSYRYYNDYYGLDYYIVYNYDGSYTMYFTDGTSLTVYRDNTVYYTEKNGTRTRYSSPSVWISSRSSSSNDSWDDPWLENDDGSWTYFSTDGTVTTFYRDGTYEVWAGGETRYYDEYDNETFRRTYGENGIEETYDSESDTYTYTDEDGEMYIRYSDGSFSIQYPDGSFENYDRYGNLDVETSYLPDDAKEIYDPDINMYTYTDESGEVYERYSDGSYSITYPDGSFETYDRYGNLETSDDSVYYEVYDPTSGWGWNDRPYEYDSGYYEVDDYGYDYDYDYDYDEDDYDYDYDYDYDEDDDDYDFDFDEDEDDYYDYDYDYYDSYGGDWWDY